jgi:anaerobic ribonucleoside-triphosphate reductase activating protein
MIKIAGISPNSITNGLGIRYTIFIQGCNHNCYNCHNPHTHSFDGGIFISKDDIIKDIKYNFLLDGVTISGGEPFEQAKELIPLIKEIKTLNLNIWIYTGYTLEYLLQDKQSYKYNMVCLADILVDGKYQENNKTKNLQFRGSTNQRIIDIKQTLKQNKIIQKYF